MGAIAGIVSLHKDIDTAHAGSLMVEKLSVYSYDKAEQHSDTHKFLFCGLQFHTPESCFEQLPRCAGRDWITADAIIDNRAELFKQLGVPHDKRDAMTDSELILLAYHKWGEDCADRLIGDYAFAIWNEDNKRLFVARDPAGARTLYYVHTSRLFAFCTLEKPLLEVLRLTEGEVNLNENWIADFLAIDGIPHEMQAEQTVYEKVYQLPPAHDGIWDGDQFKKRQYWDPIGRGNPIRFETDDQYVEEFNRIFEEAVACRRRSVGEVGVMLSGGMDSGSVACVAARQMARKQEKLYAYSSIPVDSFNEQPGKRLVYNERNEIRLVADMYPNISVQYCSFEGVHARTGADELIAILEQPHKIFQNMTWYRSILKLASTSNCKVMLTGQLGNGTISYGDYRIHFLTLFRQFRLFECWKEIVGLSRLHNVPVKKTLKLTAAIVIPRFAVRWKRRNQLRGFDRFHNVLVNRSFIGKWKLRERLDAFGANLDIEQYLDYEEEKPKRCGLLPLSHIGAIETKLSLANRIAIRDPSRDKRIIEFCLNIPSEQFVREGQERYLLRRAMKGILPDAIRLNASTRGVQSADWVYRLEREWGQIKQELHEILANDQAMTYLERGQLEKMLSAAGDDIYSINEDTLRRCLIAIVFHRFVKDFHHSYGTEAAKS